jgi:ABC-type microcin C transport system permease subunit YejE
MEKGDWEHPLGTDRLGRDVLSRIIYGSRISLLVSIVAIGIAGTVGTALGLISGYRGGVTDAILMRLTDIGLSLPAILIAVVLVAVSEPSFRNVVLIIAVLLWPRFARQIRGETLAIKEQDFVALAVVAGRSSVWIIRRHIFPNVMPTLLVITTLQVGYVGQHGTHLMVPMPYLQRQSLPNSACAMPTPHRMKYFQAASIPAGVRYRLTNSTVANVAASMATHRMPTLLVSNASNMVKVNNWYMLW